MPLYSLDGDELSPIEPTTFAGEGITERGDLQRLLRDHIEVVAPGCMVLDEEFGSWDESRRRIDLLCVNQGGDLVVVELKRTQDGGHMELQALRYAAMVSAMTFEQAVSAHADYLRRRGIEGDAEGRLLEFLEWEEPKEDEFASEVRIVLVAADFSKELTTSVMWLLERELSIRCVRLKPYTVAGQLVVDAVQVLPLPEAEDYTVRVREKERRERRSRESSRDLTKYDVTVDGVTQRRLPKNAAMLAMFLALTGKGVSPEAIRDSVGFRRSNYFVSA